VLDTGGITAGGGGGGGGAGGAGASLDPPPPQAVSNKPNKIGTSRGRKRRSSPSLGDSQMIVMAILL
jgi:hypothetical protein